MGMRGRGDFGSRGDGRGGGFGGRDNSALADITLIMIAVIIEVVCYVIICRYLCFAHISVILLFCICDVKNCSIVLKVVEVVEWTEVVEVVVLTGEVVVELPWVVIDMDHLQQSEVVWYHHRVGQWPREVDLKEHKVLMVTLLILILRGQS